MEICMVCSSEKCELIYDRIREGKRDVFRCDECGFVWLGGRGENEKKTADEYYNSEEYVSKCYDSSWSFEERKEKRKKSLTAAINEIAGLVKEIKPGPCLEVGASVGSVIEGLRELLPEIDLYGVELNRAEADYLAQTLGKEKVFYTLDEVSSSGKKFDLIYGIHVFEHFEDPIKECEMFFSLLNPGGYIYLEIPNHDDFYLHALHGEEQKNYKEFMYHKAHPFYYNREAFSRIVDKTDFSVENIKTRQDYPIVNFFHWLLKGGPQENISVATGLGVHRENAIAWQLLSELDSSFREFLQQNSQGCTLISLLKAGKNNGGF